MSNNVKVTVSCMAAIVLLIVFALATDYGGLQWFKFIEPQKEAARRKVFKQTRSYKDGKLQDLVRYKYQYDNAKTEEDKKTLESAIRQMYAEYDETNLPVELKRFIKKIKYGEY